MIELSDDWRARLDGLPESERGAALRDIERILQDRRDRPLAHAILWDRDHPRTSQRRAVVASLQPGILYAFIMGGNRSGKSDAGAQIDVAMALGREHPDVQAWCRNNGINHMLIPSGPGTVWACALDSGDSNRYVRPKVARYLPAGSKWKNREGPGEAEVKLPNGGRVVFKNVDQGRDGFQGDSVRMVRFDEEPTDYAVVGEALMRVVDQRGRVLFTMTPLMGWTRLLRENVEQPKPNVSVVSIYGEDNPHVDTDFLMAALSKFGEHEQAARRRGEVTVLDGVIYPFDPAVHLVDPFPIPPEWPKWQAIDFGTRNPFCCLWFAKDPSDDVVHVYDEHYQPGWTIGQHAAALKAKGLHGQTAADPEDLGARMELEQDHGIATVAANKAVRDGINAVCERMGLDARRRTHLVFHRGMTPNLQREIVSYRWAPTTGQKDGAEQPLKANDHACDALRYGVMHDGWTGTLDFGIDVA